MRINQQCDDKLVVYFDDKLFIDQACERILNLVTLENKKRKLFDAIEDTRRKKTKEGKNAFSMNQFVPFI